MSTASPIGSDGSDGSGLGARVTRRRRDARLVILQVLVMSLIGTLFLRLVWMQVGEGAQYRTSAKSNSVRELVIPAQRGLILDQVGRPMVANRSSLTVTVERAELGRQKDAGRSVLTALATKLGTTYDALVDRMKPCGTPGAPKQPLCWNGSAQQPVVVAEDVSQAVGLQLMEQQRDLPAVRTELRPARAYPKPYGINLAHAAGYLGPVTEAELAKIDPESADALVDTVGRAGLEQQYDTPLRGQPGVQKVAVSRSGEVTSTLKDTSAIPGNNLVTNIDAHLQAVAEQQLQAAIRLGRESGLAADSGAMIVMDVSNGRILALASNPTYDPGLWVGGIDERDYAALTNPKGGTPLLDRAIQGVYAPASTFKVVSTAAALRSGYSTTGTLPCPSAYNVGGQAFRNYESHSYGDITLAKALSVSCDTVFYRLANQMWQKDGGLKPKASVEESMLREARDFGLGKLTGIDLPAETKGRLVGRAEKKANYAEMREVYCQRAAAGYPEVQPPQRANLLKAYAKDFCAEGDRFRAGDALNFAIGQGDTAVTPLQMTAVYAALANGGTLWQPQVARAVVSRDGGVQQSAQPQQNGKLGASASTIEYIRSALADTTVTGTARGAFAGFPHDRIGVAAKTGTGEVVGKGSTSWFASFAPVAKPRYAVLCMVSQGGTGAGTCGPSVRAVYEALFGISGSTVDSSKSVLIGGAPSESIPSVNNDGIGRKLAGPTATAAAPGPSATPSAAESPGGVGAVGGETAVAQPASPTKAPQPAPGRGPGEADVGIVSPTVRPTAGRQR